MLKGITTIITSLHDIMAKEKIGVSTLADNIIALWFDKSEDKIKKIITVLKERGSSHDTRIKGLNFREYESGY